MGFQTLPFFLPLLSVWEVPFFKPCMSTEMPEQLTKCSFRPVLSPAPGDELCMAARAKSELRKVIQGQIPPCSELPSAPQWGLVSVQHLAGVTPCLQHCTVCKPRCVQLLTNFPRHCAAGAAQHGDLRGSAKAPGGQECGVYSHCKPALFHFHEA